MDFACLSRGTHSTWAHSGTSRGSGMKEIWSNMEQSHSDVARSSGKIMNKLKDQWSPWGGFGSPREDSAGSEEPSRVVLVDLANTRHFAQAKEEGHLCCTQGTHGCFMDISWIFHGCFMMLHNVSCFLGVLQVAVSKFGRSCHVLSGPEAGVRLPMTPTPARAGARFSPYEPKESQETSGDFGFILWRKKRNEKGNIEFTWIYDELQSVTYPHRSSVAIGLLERADCFNCFKLRELRAV